MPSDITRRALLCWLVPACGTCLSVPLGAEGLEVRLVNGRIRIAAPRLHFVEGKPLERLHNGAPVPFAMQLSLSTDRFATTIGRDIERFILSYDLWEERISVAKLGHPRQSISGLTAAAAETWCVDKMAVAPAGFGQNQPFWVRLEVREEDPDAAASAESEDPMSLARLIDIFSRRTRGEKTRWSAEGGPYRLATLKTGMAGERR